MALNSVSVASQMNSFYNTLKLNTISNSPGKSYPDDPKTKWVDAFMSYYDKDSVNATMSKPSVVIVSMKSLLKFSPPGCDKMGTAIANYWAAQITPGAPSSCGGSVASVVNDATKIGPLINSYMCGLPGNVESKPYYGALFSFIEAQVKTIVWTVTETGTGNGPCTYTVTAS